jgi:hypothetical protein
MTTRILVSSPGQRRLRSHTHTQPLGIASSHRSSQGRVLGHHNSLLSTAFSYMLTVFLVDRRRHPLLYGVLPEQVLQSPTLR